MSEEDMIDYLKGKRIFTELTHAEQLRINQPVFPFLRPEWQRQLDSIY